MGLREVFFHSSLVLIQADGFFSLSFFFKRMANLTCITVKNGRWFVIRVVEVVSIPVGRNIPQGIIFIEQKFGVRHLLVRFPDPLVTK